MARRGSTAGSVHAAEERLLLALHRRARPWLDGAFRVSHGLGTISFCAGVFAASSAWQLRRRQRREALLSAGLGLGTFALQAGLKPLLARPRPTLWPRSIQEPGYSFPSGHALAAATVYPLLARSLTPRGVRGARLARAAAAGLACFVGVGRLYLGLHWPTDVLAGWALGAGQLGLARSLARR